MKILCIGRNYAAHAKELKNEVPEAPVIFMKPESSILPPGHPFVYPEFSKDIHYECEIVLKISRVGKYISEENALSYIEGIGLGIDFTARDLQAQLKSKGLPWEISKGFNGSAVLSDFLPVSSFSDLQNLHFELKVNGEIRQKGHSADMLFSIPQMIAYTSQFFTLKTGDYFFTGTPEGVGPIAIGDKLEGFLEGRPMFSIRIK